MSEENNIISFKKKVTKKNKKKKKNMPITFDALAQVRVSDTMVELSVTSPGILLDVKQALELALVLASAIKCAMENSKDK